MSWPPRRRGWFKPGKAESALNNMCAPPRTKVQSRQLSVSGRIVLFTTVGACVHLGLLQSMNPDEALRQANERWGRDVECFLREVRGLGLLTAAAEIAIATWPAPVIGWTPSYGPVPGTPTVICTDLGWVIAVLGRVAGPLLMPKRAPKLTWERLFTAPFALDDARLASLPGYLYPPRGAA